MPFPQYIDNTMRGTFVACPHKFRRSFIDNLAPIEPSIHLHAGGALASALDTTRKAFYGGGKSEPEALALGATELIRFWGDFPAEHETKSLPRMLLAFDDYFREYPLPSDAIKPLMLSGNKPCTEFSFALPLPINNPDTGEPLLYTGRFDMLGVFNETLFVVDEKTTSQLGQMWQQQWDLKSQFTGYCAAARSFGYPVAGAIVRGIGLLKNDTSFAQVIEYRPDWQIDRWYAQLLRDINRMIACYRENEFDYALDEACASYGGCAFRRLCLSQNPENWIEGYFTERNWNPLATVVNA
jgi:hypothetical protein